MSNINIAKNENVNITQNENVNITQNENAPSRMLLTQVNHIKDQNSAYAEFDSHGIDFNGEKSEKDKEIKLFIPVENFSNNKNNNENTVSLMCIFIIIIAIICYLHRTR
jgi:hypothetical protein